MRFELEIVGTHPILMHNARLANPLDEHARAIKKISGKRNKTEEDHRAMADLEMVGGMYHDAELGPFIPGANIHATLVAAARRRKLGKKLTEAVFVEDAFNPLVYKGPRDIAGLVADHNFRHEASVKVGTSRVIRTRPMFRVWGLTAVLNMDEDGMDRDDLAQIVETSGTVIGLCDWRPIYGRYNSTLKLLSDD